MAAVRPTQVGCSDGPNARPEAHLASRAALIHRRSAFAGAACQC